MIKFLVLFALIACSKKDGGNDNVTPAPVITPDKPQPDEPLDGVLDSTGKYAVIKTKTKSYHTGLLKEDALRRPLGKLHTMLADCENLPEEFDLRTVGTVSPIKNQGQCGSCWSFSKTGSLESAVLAAGGKALDLSEQEQVSCDKSQWGCEGGLLTDFKYLIETGASLESDFPYTSGNTGRNGTCKPNLKHVAKGTSFAYVGTADRSPTETELKCALYKSHTVPWITVSASGAWGSPPKSEKTAYSKCGRGQTNHAVGVVGWWKDTKGKTQFIMKNSWGTDWGADGYMSLPLGCDKFGDEVAYITVEASPVCKFAKVKLPSEVTAEVGVEVMLGVKSEKDVEYSWYKDGKDVALHDAMIFVTADKEAVYKLVGKKDCGVSESSVKLKVIGG